MDQVVGEFGELIENDVVLVARELGALVVDFLDVALRSRRADDVGGIGNPFLQPVEALPAHAGGQHGHAAAAQNARYGNAAAAIISGRRPHRSVMRRLELAGHQARHQTCIGGEHLVRADQRKTPSQEDHDRRLHAGQRLRQDHIAGHRHSIAAINVVEPVNAPEVSRIGLVRADRFEAADDRRGDARRIGELAPAGQGHLRRPQAFDANTNDRWSCSSRDRQQLMEIGIQCNHSHALPTAKLENS